MIAPTYYRSRLPTRKHLQAYEQVTAGLLSGHRRISFSGSISLDAAKETVQAVHLDHPELFFVNFWQVTYCYTALGKCLSAEFEFLLEPNTITACRNSIRGKISELRRSLHGVTSPAEQYRKIADIIAADVAYRDSGNALWEHTVVGALLAHQSVCEGISKLFLLYCQHLDLPCAVITGEAGGGQKHAWNMIQPDSRILYIDVTAELQFAKTHKRCSRSLFMTQQQAEAQGYHRDLPTATEVIP